MIKVPVTLVCDVCEREETFTFSGTFTASGHLKYAEAAGNFYSHQGDHVYKSSGGWIREGMFQDLCPECTEKQSAFNALKEISEEDKPKVSAIDEVLRNVYQLGHVNDLGLTTNEIRALKGLLPLPGEDK